MVVAYWEIRGLAAPMRMMCEYGGAEYEVKHYTEKTHADWFEKDKRLRTANAQVFKVADTCADHRSPLLCCSQCERERKRERERERERQRERERERER